ncbi:hypothetical protein EBR25_03775 [bacterium]|nr:hypothetical protein [bacterium]
MNSLATMREIRYDFRGVRVAMTGSSSKGKTPSSRGRKTRAPELATPALASDGQPNSLPEHSPAGSLPEQSPAGSFPEQSPAGKNPTGEKNSTVEKNHSLIGASSRPTRHTSHSISESAITEGSVKADSAPKSISKLPHTQPTPSKQSLSKRLKSPKQTAPLTKEHFRLTQQDSTLAPSTASQALSSERKEEISSTGPPVISSRSSGSKKFISRARDRETLRELSRGYTKTRSYLGQVPFSALQLAIQTARKTGSSVPSPMFHLPEILSYCLSSDLSTLLHCSGDTEAILRIPEQQLRTQGGLLLRHVHFDDRFRVLNTLEETLLSGTPKVFAYRWTPPDPDTSQLLINHCVASQSDIGEVLTGTIFRVSPELQDELNLLLEKNINFNNTFNDSKEESLGPIINSLLLGDDLRPILGQTRNGPAHALLHHMKRVNALSSEAQSLESEPNRGVPFLPEERERVLFRQLADRVSRNRTSATDTPPSAKEHLFFRDKVYLASLERIVEKTFSPHFLFTLRDITANFLNSHELKSLRYLRDSLSTAKTSLADIERDVERILASPLLSSQLRIEMTDLKEDISASLSNLTRQVLTPFVSGQDLLLESLGTLSGEIGCEVELKVQVKQRSMYIWRSIADVLIAYLQNISKELLPLANKSTQTEIILSSISGNDIQLQFSFTVIGSSEQALNQLMQTIESSQERDALHPALAQELELVHEEGQKNTAKTSKNTYIVRMNITAIGAIHPRGTSHE